MQTRVNRKAKLYQTECKRLKQSCPTILCLEGGETIGKVVRPSLNAKIEADLLRWETSLF